MAVFDLISSLFCLVFFKYFVVFRYKEILYKEIVFPSFFFFLILNEIEVEKKNLYMNQIHRKTKKRY
jgi:hypothetical protein